MISGILTIGNELLLGSVVDTNASFIASRLLECGCDVRWILTVGDTLDEIKRALEYLDEKCDLIVASGGLGPTFDDLTREAISDYSLHRLKLERNTYKKIISRVSSRGYRLRLSHIKQAYFPEGSIIIPNSSGSADGFMIKLRHAHCIALPGVPSELKEMIDQHLCGLLKEIHHVHPPFLATLRIIGIAESDVDAALSRVDKDGLEVVINAAEGEIILRVLSKDRDILKRFCDNAMSLFKDHLFSVDGKAIEDVVSDELMRLNLKLAIVESFTGGRLSELMSSKPCFAGALIVNVEDEKQLHEAGGDITIWPRKLHGNKFELLIKHKEQVEKIDTQYAGNRLFLRTSASKRSLWHLYRFLKKKT